MKLRYYQDEAVTATHDEWQRHRSTAIIMPTATGKTAIYLHIAVQEQGRVLVLVHRDYLISAPVARLLAEGFTDIAVEKAEKFAERGSRRANIVFASVQSIGPAARNNRLESFDPRDFSLLIIDEGHRAVANSYRNVINYFQSRNPKLKLLVLTATPKRKDGVALGNICESVAYQMTPAQAAREGWIAPPRFFVRDVPHLDFSHITRRGSDLNREQMEEALLEEEPLHRVCASLAEDQGPTIVFCPGVAVAHAYAALLSNRYRPGRAVAIHEGSSNSECERATRGLEDGKIDWLFNVDKITEGYDVPRVERVAWAAPTASLVRWTQGCGRGFRVDASIADLLTGGREQSAQRRLLIEQSVKPFCSIVTYHPSNCQHQICSSVDLLGGHDVPAEFRDIATQVETQTARQAGGSDTFEDMETAKVFLDLRGVLEERRRNLKARATVSDEEYNGLGGQSRKRRDHQENTKVIERIETASSWGGGDLATEKQRWWLAKHGVTDVAMSGITKWQACVARDLYENGVSLKTALLWPRKQALAVRDELRARQTSEGQDEGQQVERQQVKDDKAIVP